jgi:hypothetical protein
MRPNKLITASPAVWDCGQAGTRSGSSASRWFHSCLLPLVGKPCQTATAQPGSALGGQRIQTYSGRLEGEHQCSSPGSHVCGRSPTACRGEASSLPSRCCPALHGADQPLHGAGGRIRSWHPSCTVWSLYCTQGLKDARGSWLHSPSEIYGGLHPTYSTAYSRPTAYSLRRPAALQGDAQLPLGAERMDPHVACSRRSALCHPFQIALCGSPCTGDALCL